MSRGRKPNAGSTGLDSEQIFNKSKGVYFRYIAKRLGETNKRLSSDEAGDLLTIIRKAKEESSDKKQSKNGRLSEIDSTEIPFPIPSNWIWCRFKEIGVFTGGGTPSMSNSQYWDGDISWISPKDMGLEYVSESEMKITPLGVKNSAAKLIPPNSLLIVGRSGILKRKLPVAINQTECTVNQDMKVMIPYLTEMSRYLQIMLFGLQEIVLKDYVKFGMTVHSLKYREFEEMPIPLPPLSEQRKILAFLQDFGKNELDTNKEYFDSEIENEVVAIHQAQVYNNQISTELDHQLALVKELRQAYLREAMQGRLVPQDPTDETAELLLEKIKAEKERLDVRTKRLEPIKTEEIRFEIPSNWTWCRLNDICESIVDCPHSTPKYLDIDTGFYGIDTNCIDEKGNIVKLRSLSEESYIERIRRLVPTENDIVYSREGSIGLAAFIPPDKKICLGQRVMLLRSSKMINLNYLKFVISSEVYKNRLLEKHRGIGAKHVNVKDIVNSLVSLPPLAEQGRIVAKLEKLMKSCDELEATIKQGITNADRLLQTALREALEPKDRSVIRGKANG